MDSALTSLSPATAERFVLERCLGTGATGTVYRAFDRTRGATVALKVLALADPGSLLLGCAASFEDRSAAVALLGEVEGQFEALDMQLHAAVTRHRRAELVGGGRGAELRGDAEARMRQLGVVRPDRFVNVLAPGFPSGG